MAKRHKVRLIVNIILAGILGFSFIYSSYLFLTQRRMIYYRSSYSEHYLSKLPDGIIELTYRISCGDQTVFYLPPRVNPRQKPESLWVLFNGRAALALDWLELIRDFPDENAGFLLIEYPGYGKCKGKPSAKRILESSEAGLQRLAEFIQTDITELEKHLNLLGYSLGTGTSLQFAVRHPIERIILIAPFTSLVDMARLAVGSPLCQMLIDRYDNRARLRELVKRSDPPVVHIFHGDADDTVPFSMGQELAKLHAKQIIFHHIPGANHINIIKFARKQILEVMTEKQSRKYSMENERQNHR
ncbi:MAG: alpha/beta hydrolase [Candidatus Sumerlaeia bacterium]|nr:alpha/beta hydrolase [Candidatus Sumerlaeia bacterium]